MIDTEAKELSEYSLAVAHSVAKRRFDNGTYHESEANFTSFLWRYQEQLFLISCYHCAFGKNGTTDTAIGSFFPNEYEFNIKHIYKVNDKHIKMVSKKIILGENSSSEWIVHPRGPQIDLACIEITNHVCSTAEYRAFNELDFDDRYKGKISDQCFIFGYPEGFSYTADLPLCKRASIATEVDIDFRNEPVFLVDTMGNKGLSGAPVIARHEGLFSPDGLVNGRLPNNAIIGRVESFAGIYSGRLGDDGLSFQLGKVWKASLVDEFFNQTL